VNIKKVVALATSLQRITKTTLAWTFGAALHQPHHLSPQCKLTQWAMINAKVEVSSYCQDRVTWFVLYVVAPNHHDPWPIWSPKPLVSPKGQRFFALIVAGQVSIQPQEQHCSTTDWKDVVEGSQNLHFCLGFLSNFIQICLKFS
jgi:hypothetical protein